MSVRITDIHAKLLMLINVGKARFVMGVMQE